MATQQSEQQDSWTDRIQNELRIPQAQRRPLWTGVIVGLLIGILIGWFVLGWGLFPVSYEGQAYANHLNDEAQADYLSAVADAYAARRDEAALALAQYRLRAFIGEGILEESIYDAETEILELQSAMPEDAALTRDVLNANMRLENLNVLAGALRSQSETTAESATEQGATTDAATAPESDANVGTDQTNNAVQPANSNDGGMSLWQWLLIGFFAVLLIGGGISLLRYLTKRDPGGGDGDVDTQARSSDSGGDEPEEKVVNRGYKVNPHTTTAGAPAVEQSAGLPPHVLASTVDPDEYADYGFPTDDDDDGAETGGSATGSVYAQVDFDESDWPENLDVPEPPLAAAVEQPTPINRPQAMRGMKIATHIAEFQIGVSDYDQAFALIDPDNGLNIGDCGVGVTMPGGLRDNSPEEVISLDVWLFDKLDDERIGNYKRVLISEYVIDHGMETAFADIQGAVGTPIVAQPGLTFEIEGENLKLLCRVIEAEYSENGATKGIFTNVKVEMSVLKKR